MKSILVVFILMGLVGCRNQERPANGRVQTYRPHEGKGEEAQDFGVLLEGAKKKLGSGPKGQEVLSQLQDLQDRKIVVGIRPIRIGDPAAQKGHAGGINRVGKGQYEILLPRQTDEGVLAQALAHELVHIIHDQALDQIEARDQDLKKKGRKGSFALKQNRDLNQDELRNALYALHVIYFKEYKAYALNSELTSEGLPPVIEAKGGVELAQYVVDHYTPREHLKPASLDVLLESVENHEEITSAIQFFNSKGL